MARGDDAATRRRHADRLIHGYVGGRRRGPWRTAVAIGTARRIDEAMGRCGLARPGLLVSGFWRSGTTWLQESLAAGLGGKTVFEPLSPFEPGRGLALAHLYPDDTEDLRQATIPGPQPQGSAFWSALDEVCTGQRATTYLLSCRRSVAESLRRTLVVKDVRLQANLAGFHHRYGTPVVHVRRHPCAVAASLKAADWHWSFARTPLARLLDRLSPALSAEEQAAALRFDTDGLSRTAAFWAVTERLAAAAVEGQSWGLAVLYEDFAARPQTVLSRIFGRLGLGPMRAVDVSAPSVSVDPAVFASYHSSPEDRWRNLLSGDEIARVEAIVDAIHPEWRSDVPTERAG